jgi:hypothetical protein
MSTKEVIQYTLCKIDRKLRVFLFNQPDNSVKHFFSLLLLSGLLLPLNLSHRHSQRMNMVKQGYTLQSFGPAQYHGRFLTRGINLTFSETGRIYKCK